MKQWRSVSILLSAAVVGMHCSAAHAEHWYEARLGDFHIISELSRGQTEDIARDLQIYQIAVKKFFPNVDVQPHVPVTIFVIDRKMWRTYLPAQKNFAGLTYPADDQMNIVVDGDSWLQAEPIVYHELTHILLHKSFYGAALPVWLDEGYADFMSTVEVGKDSVKVGLPAAWRYYSMQQLPWTPLSNLLGVARDSPTYTKEKLAEAFYAQSWLIVHYIIFGNPSRGKQVREYLNLLTAGYKTDQAFAQAFPGDSGQFEKELMKYSRATRFDYLNFPVPDVKAKSQTAVQGIAWPTVADEFGQWMMRYSNLDPDDLKFLEQRVKDDPKNALAIIHLGQAYLRKDRIEDATPLVSSVCDRPMSEFEQANLALNCGYATVRIGVAIRRAAQHRQKNDADEQKASQSTSAEDLNIEDTSANGLDDRLKAHKFFMRALELEPANLTALIAAATTSSVDTSDSTDIRNGLERALAKDPNNPMIAYYLSTLYYGTDLRKVQEYLERAILHVVDPQQTRQLLAQLRDIEDELAQQAKH